MAQRNRRITRALSTAIAILLLCTPLTSKAPTDGEEGFLDAINGEPFNNELHLIYADWLDENGRGPEAKFIRLSVEILQISSLEREKALSIADRQKLATLEIERQRLWESHIAKIYNIDSLKRVFGNQANLSLKLAPRGLVSTHPGQLHIKHMDWFLKKFRSAYKVSIYILDSADIKSSSQWSRVRSLDISAPGRADVHKVLESKMLKKILNLDIGGLPTGDGRALNSALKRPAFSQLESLHLHFAGDFENGASLLTNVQFRLRNLSITSSNRPLNSLELSKILESPAAQNIIALTIGSVDWSSEQHAPRLIATIKRLEQLTKLEIVGRSPMSLEHFRSLFSGDLRARLREISIAGLDTSNRSVDERLLWLSEHGKWAQLDSLEVHSFGSTPIDTRTIETVLNAKFPELTRLSILAPSPNIVTQDYAKEQYLPPRAISSSSWRPGAKRRKTVCEGR